LAALIPAIAADATVVWSLRLSLCLSHSWTVLISLDGMRGHFEQTDTRAALTNQHCIRQCTAISECYQLANVGTLYLGHYQGVTAWMGDCLRTGKPSWYTGCAKK